MRNFLFTIIALSFIISCNNDFELNEKWKDVPVTYGILNPSDTAQYIRIEKVFNNPTVSGLEIAKNADSLYYKNLLVKLIKEKSKEEFILEKIDANNDGHKRDTGIFATSPNFLYKIKSSDIKLKEGEDYTLLLLKNNDTLAFAKTKIVNKPEIFRPSSSTWPVNLGYITYFKVTWKNEANVGYYDLIIDFHIKEREKNEEWEEKTLRWKVKEGLTNSVFNILERDFYIFLKNELKVNDNIEREFVSFDIIVRGVSKELKQYTDILNANLGITSSQQIPTYTNMSNGYGLFTSINTSNIDDFILQDESLDSLANGIYTGDLGFN